MSGVSLIHYITILLLHLFSCMYVSPHSHVHYLLSLLFFMPLSCVIECINSELLS